MNQISIGLAFIAGIASFLSPCVLPLVPAYIGYLGGRTASTVGGEYSRSGKPLGNGFTHSLAFVSGFSLVFILLGGFFAFLGSSLFLLKTWLPRIGGLIVVIFGLQLTGLIRVPFLEMDLHPQTPQQTRQSYGSSFLMGIIFSAGWSPCLGPVLSSILALALNEGSIWEGILLLAVYSLGLAVPFLAASFAIDWVVKILKKYGKALNVIQIGMGALLILIGILLVTGRYQVFSQIGNWNFAGL